MIFYFIIFCQKLPIFERNFCFKQLSFLKNLWKEVKENYRRKFSVCEKVNNKCKMTQRIKPEENERISSSSKSNFAKFCKDTSLHGWSYLNHSKMPKVWKFFWSTFLIIIVLLSVFFFVINTNQVKLN